MSRYCFDIHDDHSLIRDDVGDECADAKVIRQMAMETLPQIARDEIPKDGDQQAYTVLVRNERNLTLYSGATVLIGGLAEDDAQNFAAFVRASDRLQASRTGRVVARGGQGLLKSVTA
ncbi:DUF6894 family protein [Methylobacterium sp. C25]|uniref:DUF6894 family protein n=1 Tax=Methylobacterium sp. C25 TaxID=2721622 RepID=UPI001F3B9D49|nr:hypothetical protein [Methylobacterium sp. C25]